MSDLKNAADVCKTVETGRIRGFSCTGKPLFYELDLGLMVINLFIASILF